MALIASVENGKVVSTASETEKTTASNNDLGYDQFLQLLCAEMQYQDPLEPTSNTDYVAQLATFSQMEAMLSMQNTIENSNTNALVGKYVIVKSTSATTGETTAVAGFVDFVHYENGKQYLSVNGNLYSVDDLYEVADTDYMEAVSLSEAFMASVAKLPDVKNLTAAWKEDVDNLVTVYNSLTSYQKSYISDDVLTKFKEIVAQMQTLTGSTSDSSSTTGTDGTPGSGSSTNSGNSNSSNSTTTTT